VKETCKQIIRTNKYKEIDRRSSKETMSKYQIKEENNMKGNCTATTQKPITRQFDQLETCKKHPKKHWENHEVIKNQVRTK